MIYTHHIYQRTDILRSYLYVLSPVLSGVLILLAVALIFNNLTPHRRYPTDGRFSRTIKWMIRPARRHVKRLKGNKAL